MLVKSTWQAYARACCRSSRPNQAKSRFCSLTAAPVARHTNPRSFTTNAWNHRESEAPDTGPLYTKEVRERKQELERANVKAYPRLRPQVDVPGAIPSTPTVLDDVDDYHNEKDGILYENIAGRIMSIRLSGKKLVFFDIQTDLSSRQLMLNYAALNGAKPTEDEFRDRCRLLRRGDHIIVEVTPVNPLDAQSTLRALTMPVLQSPCLQRLPVSTTQRPADPDSGTSIDRHVEMLVSEDAVSTIIFRHNVLHQLRHFFSQLLNFVEAHTPILSAQAGGATARPFETTAAEFPNRKLALRVAPELWLKRLLIGGLTRVFEVGPCFRNEGLDKTHNPEFTTCEFYAAYWSLSKLKQTTEKLLTYLVIQLNRAKSVYDQDIARDILPNHAKFMEGDEDAYIAPRNFPTIDFIPAINTLLGVELPNLASPTARDDVLRIFEAKGIALPDKPTLPRLLDELSSQFLEPHCYAPTWIENIPECLSPLSKSFIHPTAPNRQPVAARAELFIRGKELVNCYEEENDPFEQRRKFVEQQTYARDPDSGAVDEEAMKIDADYIRALEWGLPPTGGWGIGIDRLIMLLRGKDKIADVLTFGNLRAVTRGAEKWEKKDKDRKEIESK